MKPHITLGLIGFGTIGSGTLQLFKEHKADVETRVGASVRFKWVCAKEYKVPHLIDASIRKTNRWQDVVFDPEVDCIIELIGGNEPARTIVISALRADKHVVTANKAILSKYWDEIFGIALKRRRLVYFEAAVGGGVPVIQALNEGLAGNKIHKIVGILNGTTNFILTQMQEKGMGFDEALKEAQGAGFAEVDPSFDIDGIDAAQKISILASLAAGQWLPPNRVYCEGIRQIQSYDMRVVQDKYHSTIKLLAIAEKLPQGWLLRVHPALVPLTHPFAHARNEYNAIALHGNAVNDVMLYGKGAGRLPTASAVLSDLIFLCRQIANGTAGQLPYVSRRDHRKLDFASMEDAQGRYYLRVNTIDKPGVLSKITGILGRHKVSIASVHQDEFEEDPRRRVVPVILLTHDSLEKDVQASVKEINRLPTTKAKTVLLRMA
ncbi:MAG: homoserine dehydrogenase [Elusimicrobia bacterium]|nr:homoserine dehydrogenase [Candidatus Obscuribacterium magneticum]